MAYERSYSQNSIVLISFVNARFSLIILFGSLQPQSKPICRTGTTFLIVVPSDHGNKIHVFCRVCCLHWLEFWTLWFVKRLCVSRNLSCQDCVTTNDSTHPRHYGHFWSYILIYFFRPKAWHYFQWAGPFSNEFRKLLEFFFFEKQTERKRIPEPVIVCFRQAERGKK